jgi:coenzyme F420-reducing hydrogenase alpha subunit
MSLAAPNSPTPKSDSAVKVDLLARVEGEGALLIKVKGGRVQELKLKIPEPPRLFEAVLRGRHWREAPDITSRICGICPVAYQMSAVHAIERALGIPIHPAVRALRRLFYCGEWIESHILHVFFLHAPDFLGVDDALQLAATHRDIVEQALRLKKAGNAIVACIGGREIHPVSARPGGFHRVPSRAALRALIPELEWALEAAERLTRAVAAFPAPPFEPDAEFVALHHGAEYAINEGRLLSSRGLDIPPEEYEDHFVEVHVRHSNALHSQLRERGAYLTGPLARFHLNFEQLTPRAKRAAVQTGAVPPVRNPFRGALVRMIETVFACEEALAIAQQYEPPVLPFASAPPRAASGSAITEAPRGILYHRYSFDAAGLIEHCRIVPPTAQNLRRIEEDLWQLVPASLHLTPGELTRRCEMAVRNYDPCISCATHFLKVRVERL